MTFCVKLTFFVSTTKESRIKFFYNYLFYFFPVLSIIVNVIGLEWLRTLIRYPHTYTTLFPPYHLEAAQTKVCVVSFFMLTEIENYSAFPISVILGGAASLFAIISANIYRIAKIPTAEAQVCANRVRGRRETLLAP